MRIPLMFAIVIVGFAGGQITGLEVFPGVRVYALDVAIGLVLVYCAFAPRKKKRVLPALWPSFIAFGGAGLISVLMNRGGVPPFAQGIGMLYLVRWLFYAALYWAAVTDVISPKAWLGTLYSAGVAIAGLGLVQYAWYPNLRNLYYLGWDPHYQRLFSTLLDPNFTGIILVCALLLGMARKAPILGQVLLFLALLLTYSRSSYVALVAAGIVLACYSKGMRKFLGGAAIIFLMLLILLPKTGEGRDLLRQASGAARRENMREGLELFVRSPIVGYGFNTLRYLPSRQAGVRQDPTLSHASAGFDMSLIFAATTTGAIGLGVYLWLMARMFLAGRHNMWFTAALIAIWVHAIFVNSLFYPWVMAFVWIWAGTIRASRAAR